jgi:hypothetical protein
MAELADACKDEVLGEHSVNEDLLPGAFEKLEDVGEVLMEGSFDSVVRLEIEDN